MKKIAILCLLFTSTTALSEEIPAPTVNLTAFELQAIINAEIARAKADAAYQKVQSAFAPKTPMPKIEEKK